MRTVFWLSIALALALVLMACGMPPAGPVSNAPQPTPLPQSAVSPSPPIVLVATPTRRAASSGPAQPAPTSAPGGGDVLAVLRADGRFNTLVRLLDETGVAAELQGAGPWTVLAPTDEAFAQLPPGTIEALLEEGETLRAILRYHLVAERLSSQELAGRGALQSLAGLALLVRREGDVLWVNEGRLVARDIAAENGVIHALDAVLLSPEPARNIMSVLAQDGRFTQLIELLGGTWLSEALMAPGPLTLLAPTDEALATLPPDRLAALRGDEQALTRFLQGYIVPRRVSLAELTAGPCYTMAGTALHATQGEKGVVINGAPVLEGDIEAINGLIHILGAPLP